MKNNAKKFKQKRKWWYNCMKFLMRARYPQPEFRYLGEKPTNGDFIALIADKIRLQNKIR